MPRWLKARVVNWWKKRIETAGPSLNNDDSTLRSHREVLAPARLVVVHLCALVHYRELPQAWYCLARTGAASWDNNDYTSAAARYEDFLRDNPRDPQAAQARFKVGNIYLHNLKQQELAIQHYIHLIEDFPKSPEIPQARQRLAESYAAAKKPREASWSMKTCS